MQAGRGAQAGDGVLFFDADGSGDISERKEYVFTDWDPTATSDLEALRSVFDTNGDGKLTNADTTWSQFRVADRTDKPTFFQWKLNQDREWWNEHQI